MRAPRILQTGELAPNVVKYSVLAFVAANMASIFMIPLLPITLPIAWYYYRRYYASLEVVLTSRELQVARGVLNRQEKSIPLEKITDLAVYQGPIMRYMGLKGIQVETAGQSGAGSALVKIVGLVNTESFREAALDQRDKVTDRLGEAPAPAAVAPGDGDTAALLAQISETLLRIERRLPPPSP